MIDSQTLSSLLENLKTTHVVCVGDIILDLFVHGTVSRISPEAPVPVLLETRRSFTLGGVGNVVRNLSSVGASCTFIGVVGEDKDGGHIQDLTNDLKNVEAHLIQSPHRPTTKKIRYLSQRGSQVLRVDREHTTDIKDATMDKVLEAVKSNLTPRSALILSDYDKGVLSARVLSELIAYAKSLGVFVAVDPKGSDYSIYRGANLVTPNLKELNEATNTSAETDEEVILSASQVIDTCDINSVLVTRSEKGMSLIGKGAEPIHIPTKAREVFDVSGAGDTVISMITAAQQTGASLEVSAHLANNAAGIVVGKVGTATVTPDEIKCASAPEYGLESLVLTRDMAVNQVTLWHRQAHKVGFTNGCFDLLHPGHIKILKESRAACDRLVVGLNSDVSVKRLKGEMRPIQDEASRAEVLSALEYVDMVVIFSEDTPKELIEVLRPDVLIKGADYTVDTVVGADFVQSYGGKVKLIDLVPNQSTTNTLKKMS